ncbi:methyltransferase domain-containing protein [Campylobacter curvus]|uniref:methyltransferase domain-containing protein n=1 Tax=Campylobacter curvus TaxID=200 RepID=UPI0014707E47
MSRLKYFSNYSTTGYGADSEFIPIVTNILNDMKRDKKSIRVLDFGYSQKPYKCLFNDFDNVVEYVRLDVYPGDKVDVVYDGGKIPFEDEYFDIIFSTFVLEHVENLDDTLKEIYRVIKTEGEGYGA